MADCSWCGAEYDGASVFCAHCGAVQAPAEQAGRHAAAPPAQQPPAGSWGAPAPPPPPVAGWGAVVPPPPPAQGWNAAAGPAAGQDWGTQPAGAWRQDPGTQPAAGAWAPEPQQWSAPDPGAQWPAEPGWETQQPGWGAQQEEYADPDPPRRDPKVLILLLALVGLLVVGGVVAFLLTSRHGGTAPSAAATSSADAPSSSGAATSAAPHSATAAPVTATPEVQPAGGAAPLKLVATGADCSYPPSVDGNNHPVTYDAANAVDTDPATAWRCPGAGGHTIQLQLGRPGQVTDLGLVPGYAKVDPATGVDRFTDNHTVTQVIWQLDENGTPVKITQDIPAPTPQMAWVHLSRPVAARSISLTVTGTGNLQSRQDSTPISTIAAAGH